MTQREAVLVVNTASRLGRESFRHGRRLLEERGITVVAAVSVRKPKLIPGIVRRAIARGHRLIVVGGGDGTVSAVIGAFAQSRATLGLLPIGTGNSFARGLDLPLDIEGAVDTIVNGKEILVDLATVNGTYFANVATIGLATRVGRYTPNRLKRWLGPIAYLLVGIRETLKNPSFHLRCVTGEGTAYACPAQQIVIANGRMFGTTPILPDATLDDERLAVYIVKGSRRSALAAMWVGMLFGGFHTKLDTALYFHVKDLYLSTVPAKSIDIDGEPAGRTPARFAVVPKALRVIAPAAFQEHSH